MTPEKFAALGHFDKLLIDPPRSGAIEVVKSLPDATETERGAPQRIVYVSFDPATLARAAEVLVHVQGYRLESAGVTNMFPHTEHEGRTKERRVGDACACKYNFRASR